MERKLPEIIIEGTCFLLDVEKMELRQQNNPENIISVFDMRDRGNGGGYVFEYNKIEKNVALPWAGDETAIVNLPELISLDPEGMSKKYGIPLEMFATKTDFDVMVDQTALKERLSGRLPTVDIAGHTFYVDLRMDMLRPKDDFLSRGIEFSKIEDYYIDEKEKYCVPYNPKTHEFQEFDVTRITEIPKDLIMVSFPHESKLDPIGYNRKLGVGDTDYLKETNLKSNFKAGQIPWKDTGIDEFIEKNKAKSLKNEFQTKPVPTKNKGRKL